MNSSDNRGRFGEECDWWSLGICAYEMLFGKTPFTDEKGSMVVTYANIMSFKKCLKFPTETEVTSDAMNLMKCLLTDADRRLKYEGICIHRFFSDIDFDNIRQTTPPFIPTITSKDDTSNFDEFEKAQSPPSLDQYKRKTEFSGKDLPFIGFTFTKSLGNERPSLTSNLTSEVSSPAAKNSLERRLQTKTKELQDTREKCSDLENRNVNLAADKERLKAQVKEKESSLRVVQNERDCLERDVAHYISEIKSLKRLLEVEKEERNNMDSKAMVLLEEITKQNEHAQKLREETTREEVDTCHEIIAQLEEERKSLNKKIDRLEREIKDERQTSNRANSKVTELQTRLSQLQRNIKVSAEECTAEMKSREREFIMRENEFQDKLDKVYQQTHEATELLKRTREDRARLEEELMTIKRKSGVHDALRQRLSDSEEKRKSLETQMHRLEIMERREEELKRQVTEKSRHITQLAERIADIEESLQGTELEKKKEEKLAKKREQQLRDRIRELTENVEMLSNEKSNLQDQSLMAFEEHEEKLHKIQQQEATIAQLKGNISRLEGQIKGMKADLSRPRSPSPRRKMERRSGWSQTDFSPEKVLFPRRKSGWAQTDTRKSRSPVKNVDWASVWDKTNNLNTPHEQAYVYKLTGDKVRARRSKSLDKTATWVLAQNEARTVPGDRRRSNQTQTESVSRRSNQMQTEVQEMTHIPEEVVVSVKFNGDNRRSSNGTCKFADSPETGYKSDSPQSSMTENNVSSILAGHGDGPFTSHATVNLAECTFPLSTRAMKGDDSETEVFSSTVDSESEHNVTVLRHINNCDAEVQTNESREKRKKTMRRRESEEISDLKQQKLYLEARVSSLEREIQEIRDGTHQQRIRALDLKHELREKTALYETQIAELREKLCKTELWLSDAQETANNLKEKDSTLKERFEKLQRDLDVTKMDSRRNVTSLQLWKKHRLGKVHEEKNDDLEAQLKMFKERCAKLENVEQEVRTLKVESKHLAPKNKELEDQLRMALDDKTRFKMDADRYRDELNEKRRQCDTLEQRVKQLKSLCEELDSQIQDYEEMNRQYEQKESQWRQDKNTYEKAVEEREDESNDTRRLLQKERDTRQKAEERSAELNSALSSTQKAYQNEINALKKKTKEQREKIDLLNNQLTMMEKKCSLMELDEKNVNRNLLALNEENIKLKEETSKLITQTSDLKNSNLRLSKQLEEAMEKYELQANHKSDLENRIETDQANYRHELYKLESQIGQQTKLIIYLQDKVENPPKKKKGLFGGGGSGGAGSSSTMRPGGVPGIQYRELQHSLEHERDKNSTLRQEILRLRDELHVSKAEAMRNLSRSTNNTPESSLLSSASYNTAHSLSFATAQNVQQEVTLSPATQNERHHRQHRHQEFVSIDSVDGRVHSLGTMKPQRERMHHNIPHRFITGLNSRPTKCAVCLGSVHFVKPAAKCQECNVVCHPKCSASLPATCGLPTEYAKHFANMLKQARKFSTTRLSVADLKLQLEGWMKMPRPGKSVWDKKWVVLGNNHVYIYNNDNIEDADPMEEFDLRPANGFVTIHSAVTAAELTNTASTDLPYILRLEFEPETTCWPGRSLYLMALNFSDKQKWVATLEAIITHSPDTFKRKDAKLLGNTILTTSDEKRLEINCSLSLSDKNLLLGADEGLYLLDLTTATRPPVKISGVGGVYQMSLLDGTDTITVITGLKARPKDVTKRGKERQVAVVDIGHLRNANSYSTPSVSPRNVEQAYACTCFSLGVIGEGLFMCAALADRILILKWSPNLGNFSSRKELMTSQACSCMYFGKKHIIVGTDRFYKIDLYSYKMSEFLDKHDNTLAFAAFGAAYYDSFPIAVLQLAPPNDHEEFLLCYHEFGVFVDSYGRRSREDDMKWGGLPLGFAYRAPYLYITHFNTLQVVHINSSHKDSVYGNKTFLTLPTPRYLGLARSDQAVYIGSSHDRTAEILVFKGNMVALDEVDGMKSSVETSYRTCTDKENTEPLYAKITKKKSASSLRKATRTPQSKSTPLKSRNRATRHDTSDSDDSDLSLTDEALYSTPIEAKIEVRRYVGKSAYESTDADTSF